MRRRNHDVQACGSRALGHRQPAGRASGVAQLGLVDAAQSRGTVAAGGLESGATQGAAASKAADSRPVKAPRPAESKPSLSAPTSTDSTAPSRPVKKTLTYRPSAPTAADRRPAPTDLAEEVAGFVPTGAMVADLREQCGCSVAEFADLIQVTPTTVRRWEATPGALNLHAAPWEALRPLYRESRLHQG